MEQVKMLLLGKEALRKIGFGIDPGASIGLVALGDGKVIEEAIALALKKYLTTYTKYSETLTSQ